MYGLVILGLLATVIRVHSDVSYHFFARKLNDIITCNWTVQIFCDNSSVIDIYNVTILITSCWRYCTPCDRSGLSVYSTGVNTTAIQSYIINKCNYSKSCNDSLPVPEVSNNKEMTVIVYYNCTSTYTSTTKKDSGTTVSVFSSPTTHAAGISENITGTDTNTDTYPLKTNETTVGVSSSPATQADVTSSEDLDTAIQPSSLNVVSAVVPTVLVLVAITLVSLVIIARRRTGFNHTKMTANKSDYSDQEVPKNGTCANVMVPMYEQLLRQIDNTDYSYIVGSTYNVLKQEVGTGGTQAGQTEMNVSVLETMYEQLSGDRGDKTYSYITQEK